MDQCIQPCLKGASHHRQVSLFRGTFVPDSFHLPTMDPVAAKTSIVLLFVSATVGAEKREPTSFGLHSSSPAGSDP